MIFFRKKVKKETYDPEHLKPVIRVSICTGEQTAGFKEIQGGKFREVMLIRDDDDLEEFKERYGIKEEIERIY